MSLCVDARVTSLADIQSLIFPLFFVMRNLGSENKPLRLAVCKVDVSVDREFTVNNLAITPQQVADMTAKGISVAMPNSEFLDGQHFMSANDFHVEPMFRRGMTREELWSIQQDAKLRVLGAPSAQDKYIKSQKALFDQLKDAE